MAISYEPIDIAKGERLNYETMKVEPFTGYISPKGEIISFHSIFGDSGHDSWKNNASIAFIYFVSFITKTSLYQKETLIKGIISGEYNFTYMLTICQNLCKS